MLTAIAPPALAALPVADTASNYHDGWTYQAAHLRVVQRIWGSGLARHAEPLHRKNTNARVGQWTLPFNNYPFSISRRFRSETA